MTASILDALANIRRHATQQETWALLRFDGMDSTIETFYSEVRNVSPIFVPINPFYNEFQYDAHGALRRTAAGVPRGYVDSGLRVQGLPGRHVEQVLCNQFAGILGAYQTGGRVASVVEIFIRDSPCLHRSNPEGLFVQQGCAPKLIALKGMHPTVGTWLLHYVRLYVGPQHTEANARTAIANMQGVGWSVGRIDSALLL